MNQAERPKNKRGRWPRRGSPAQIAIDNIPYAVCALLGFLVLLPIHWAIAALEFVLLVAGTVWIIRTVCPHCVHMNGTDCQSGYSRLARRISPPCDPAGFSKAFSRNMPAMYPMWFLPIVGALYIVAAGGVPPLIPLALFIIVAFVYIPLKSRMVNCRRCANRRNCPWGVRIIRTGSRNAVECDPR